MRAPTASSRNHRHLFGAVARFAAAGALCCLAGLAGAQTQPVTTPGLTSKLRSSIATASS